VVKIDEFVVFPMTAVFVSFGNTVDIVVYIMTTIRSGFLLTAIRMTLNDLECPIHLKVRL